MSYKAYRLSNRKGKHKICVPQTKEFDRVIGDLYHSLTYREFFKQCKITTWYDPESDSYNETRLIVPEGTSAEWVDKVVGVINHMEQNNLSIK